jgi:hypothetical protein
MKFFTSATFMLFGASLLLSVSAIPNPAAFGELEARQREEFYEVQAGDTCFGIAQRTGADLADLQAR